MQAAVRDLGRRGRRKENNLCLVALPLEMFSARPMAAFASTLSRNRRRRGRRLEMRISIETLRGIGMAQPARLAADIVVGIGSLRPQRGERNKAEKGYTSRQSVPVKAISWYRQAARRNKSAKVIYAIHRGMLSFLFIRLRATAPRNPAGSNNHLPMNRLLWSKAAVLAAGAGTVYVLFINWCDFIFDCGCQSLWAGAADHCNIKNANPPHCPWCIEDGLYGSAAFGSIVIAQAVLAFRPGPLTRPRIFLVFLAFPVVGAAVGGLTALYTGYWAASPG